MIGEISDAKVKKMKRLAEQNKERRNSRPKNPKYRKIPKVFLEHINNFKVEKAQIFINQKMFRKEFLVTYQNDNSFICGRDVVKHGVLVVKAEEISTVQVVEDFFERGPNGMSDFSDKEAYTVKTMRLNQITKLHNVYIKRIV